MNRNIAIVALALVIGLGAFGTIHGTTEARAAGETGVHHTFQFTGATMVMDGKDVAADRVSGPFVATYVSTSPDTRVVLVMPHDRNTQAVNHFMTSLDGGSLFVPAGSFLMRARPAMRTDGSGPEPSTGSAFVSGYNTPD